MIVKITKYELRTASAVVKKEDIYEGCTLERPGDIFSEVIKTFNNLEEAKAELENYQSKVENRDKEFEVIEYYVEISEVEVIDGEEYGVINGELIFAKGDYHTEHKWLGNFGDYSLTKMDNDILIEFDDNRDKKIQFLTDDKINSLISLVEEYEDSDTLNERKTILIEINDILGI